MAQKFTAFVYEDDFKEIKRLVTLYPSIETGGDLFGLWQDEETVVIQFFIGPGKGRERTTTSFHQDVDYLAKVGSVIIKEEGLCNVGEWHSHHQIGMPNPSSGDKSTVLDNLPQLGLERFVLFIAHIKTHHGKRSYDVGIEDVEINCFMFKQHLPYDKQPIKGKMKVIAGKNPLREKGVAKNEVSHGAELEANARSETPEKRGRGRDVEQPTAQQRESWVPFSVKENQTPNVRRVEERPKPATRTSPKVGPSAYQDNQARNNPTQVGRVHAQGGF